MIEIAYTYEEEEQHLVDAFQTLPPELQLSAYWVDEELTNLRANVKTHYILQQKVRCCYCNNHLLTKNHRDWDIEHIASRADYPRFMFVTTNLAAACHGCNGAKSDKDGLVNKEALVSRRRKTYPKKSEDFRILHPHYDNFEDHILAARMIYIGKTEKGKNTIYACDLLRFASQFLNLETKAIDESFEEEVDILFDAAGDNEEIVRGIIEALPIDDI